MPVHVLRGQATAKPGGAAPAHQRTAFLMFVAAETAAAAVERGSDAMGEAWYAIDIQGAGPVEVEALNAGGQRFADAYEVAVGGGIGLVLYGDLSS